ncbi:MAG: hypothetical protein MUO82_02435 [Candidatus Thermoplasmatota archaeon]|nr:hypothetical protein [Candidatus Thermoplasmatota archaeon]
MLIQTKNQRDADRVFSILLHNGRFSEIQGNKFRIDENVKKILKEIEKKNIEIKQL